MLSNIRQALVSIWSNKARSFLTVLGVVIGVSSVCTLVALGQGLKNEVGELIRGLGTNVIAVVSGRLDTADMSGGQVNPAQLIATDILTEDDVAAIEQIEDVEQALPMALVASPVKKDGKVATPTILGSHSSFVTTFNLVDIGQGEVFAPDDDRGIVLPFSAAEQLFGENGEVVGQTVTLDGQEFTVSGVFAEPAPSLFASDFDNLALVSFAAATDLNDGEVQILRIVVKATDEADVVAVKERIEATVLANHDGEEDFTVLTQEDILDVFGQFLNLATAMVSAIAAISLVIGGIGIMNIMLVTVTERTREIGLRKAVGATRGAIMGQFLVEAVVVTLLGGVIGLGITFGVAAAVLAKTDLTPAITPAIILLGIGISTVIGLIFGLWPAYRAAAKDPIEALRYE